MLLATQLQHNKPTTLTSAPRSPLAAFPFIRPSLSDQCTFFVFKNQIMIACPKAVTFSPVRRKDEEEEMREKMNWSTETRGCCRGLWKISFFSCSNGLVLVSSFSSPPRVPHEGWNFLVLLIGATVKITHTFFLESGWSQIDLSIGVRAKEQPTVILKINLKSDRKAATEPEVQIHPSRRTLRWNFVRISSFLILFHSFDVCEFGYWMANHFLSLSLSMARILQRWICWSHHPEYAPDASLRPVERWKTIP